MEATYRKLTVRVFVFLWTDSAPVPAENGMLDDEHSSILEKVGSLRREKKKKEEEDR